MSDREAVVAHALSFQYGGMTREELGTLYDLCREKVALEIGSYVGMSSYVIASAAKKLTCVDLWPDTWGHLGREQEEVYEANRAGVPSAWEAFQRNIAPVAANIRILHGDAQALAPKVLNGSLDVLLVDGDHRYEGVARDLGKYLPKVKNQGGLVLLHDYVGTWGRGVSRAAAEAPLRHLRTVGALGVFEKAPR